MRFSHGENDGRMIKIFALFSILLGHMLSHTEIPEVWAEPIPFMEKSVKRDYRAPATQYSAGHRGIDFKLPLWEPIGSPIDGVITFAGKVIDREVVTVQTPAGYLASFEPACSKVAIGERVIRGQVIANHCPPSEQYQYHCESCVHFSARNSFGYLSPLFLMGKLEPSVLVS